MSQKQISHLPTMQHGVVSKRKCGSAERDVTSSHLVRRGRQSKASSIVLHRESRYTSSQTPEEINLASRSIRARVQFLVGV